LKYNRFNTGGFEFPLIWLLFLLEYQKIKLSIVGESDRKTFKDNKKQTMEQK
jgi:hypothetical protein